MELSRMGKEAEAAKEKTEVVKDATIDTVEKVKADGNGGKKVAGFLVVVAAVAAGVIAATQNNKKPAPAPVVAPKKKGFW